MSRQPSGGRGEVARGAGYAAFLGAMLISVAVIIGIVLLQIGDRNNNGPAGAANRSTTTTKPHSTTTTTTSGTTSGLKAKRSPSQVPLIVLNGGAATGQAAHESSALKLRGYTNQQKANTWSGHHQVGNTVYCRAGLNRAAAALAAQVPGARLIVPYPSPAPPFSAGSDCVVVIGA